MSEVQEGIASLARGEPAPSQDGHAAPARHPENHIPRRDNSEPCPLSLLQDRLWLLDQLDPGSPVYNRPLALRLTGPLDEAALRRTLDVLIDRHESLRTRFPTRAGAPVQEISPALNLNMPVVDLSHLAATEGELRVRQLFTEEVLRPFDLANDPVFRVKLLRLGSREHMLLFVIHHIAFDAWSCRVFLSEFSRVYAALATGHSPALAELPVQYADFAQWQRRRVSGERLERQIGYWKAHLDGADPVDLPTDRPRPQVQKRRAGYVEARFGEPLADSLKALARREDSTLFMLLLAAFQMLLARYTGSQDIVVASMVAGRNQVETEKLIGLFLNPFLLRTSLPGHFTFREVLRRVRESSLGALTHQELPFEHLREILTPERDRNAGAFFQVAFNFESLPDEAVEIPGLNVEEFEFQSPVSPYDLLLEILPTGRVLKAVFAYDSDLYDRATLERMAGHYRTLLEGIVAAPDRAINLLPLLTPNERQQILVDWNRTEVDYPRDSTLHELFTGHAERRPKAIAVSLAGQTLTYAELNCLANRIAHQLRRWGMGPGSRVGLSIDRSLNSLAGLLGILKAGGACVPLDPAYPQARLDFMCRDAGFRLLLTDGNSKFNLSSADVKIVNLNEWQDAASGGDDENPRLAARAEDVAYVYYTSGSSGTPKGVEVTHRGIVRLLCGSSFAHFGPDTVFLQLSSISFDASALETWGALLHGGRCVLFPHRVPEISRLGAIIKQEGVTTLWITPSFFNTLIDTSPEVLAPVREVLIGGEALSVPHICRAYPLLPHTQLVNGYGPTECGVLACCYRIPRTQSPPARSIPIGPPIANTRAYILDAALQPVPVGVSGELYLGGDGLARGYLDRTELTSQKFIRNPFIPDPEARLYKTGDSCRFLADGRIEYLGRLDTMVKLRGFRIELGELESTLAGHPDVSCAAVVAREDVPGDHRLVAYVQPYAGAAPPDAKDLRDFLKSRLPEYMLPTDFLTLTALPVTPNGKIDRRALPAISRTRQGLKRYVPPRDMQELQLASIWEDILDVRPVGIEDDFFELGGHSILAVRMMNRIEDAYGKHLPLAVLLARATIKHLAECLRTESLREVDAVIVPVQPEGSRPPLFFLHGDLWGGLYCRKLARLLGPDQPFYGVMPNGFDGTPLLPSIEAMAEENIRLLLAFRPQGPYLLGGYCNGGHIAYEMARQLKQRGIEVEMVILLDAGVPPYFRWLKALARSLGFMGLGAEAQSRLYAYMRNYMVRMRTAYRSRRLFALLRQTATRKGLLLAGAPPEELGIPSAVFDDPVQSQRFRHLAGVLFNYRPQPYSGRMTLLRTRSAVDSHVGDPTAGWGRLVPNLQVRDLPGGHATCLTEHAEDVAMRIAESLGVPSAETQVNLAP